MLRPFPPLIYKKTCFSTDRMKYLIETFRALSVARGRSSYKLTKSVSFDSSVRKPSCPSSLEVSNNVHMINLQSNVRLIAYSF